jgi:hypothetical protein
MPRKLAKETTKSIQEMGAIETINSGSIFLDGDATILFSHGINWGNYYRAVIESKLTETKSFRFTREVFDKLIKQARGALPVLLVGFVTSDKKKNEYIILRKSDFMDMVCWMDFLIERMRLLRDK